MPSLNHDTGQEVFQIRGMAQRDRDENIRLDQQVRDNERNSGSRRPNSNNLDRRNEYNQTYRRRGEIDRYRDNGKQRSRSPSRDYRKDNRGRELFANTTRPQQAPDHKENNSTVDIASRMDIDDNVSMTDGKAVGLSEVVNGVHGQTTSLKSQRDLFQDHQRNKSQTRYRQRDVSRGVRTGGRGRSRSPRRQQRGRSPARYPPHSRWDDPRRRRRQAPLYRSPRRTRSHSRQSFPRSRNSPRPRAIDDQQPWWNSRLSLEQNFREGWRLVPEDYRVFLRDCVTPNFRITNLPLWRHDRTPLENMRLFIDGMPERYMVEFGEFLEIVEGERRRVD